MANVAVLVVAGGGSGYKYEASHAVSVEEYGVTVGGGGDGVDGNGAVKGGI